MWGGQVNPGPFGQKDLMSRTDQVLRSGPVRAGPRLRGPGSSHGRARRPSGGAAADARTAIACLLLLLGTPPHGRRIVGPGDASLEAWKVNRDGQRRSRMTHLPTRGGAKTTGARPASARVRPTAANLASIEEEIARVHDELAARRSSHSSEYRRAADEARHRPSPRRPGRRRPDPHPGRRTR